MNENQSGSMIEYLDFLGDWADSVLGTVFEFAGCLCDGFGDLLEQGFNLWCDLLSFSFQAGSQFLAFLSNGAESIISNTLLTKEMIKMELVSQTKTHFFLLWTFWRKSHEKTSKCYTYLQLLDISAEQIWVFGLQIVGDFSYFGDESGVQVLSFALNTLGLFYEINYLVEKLCTQ